MRPRFLGLAAATIAAGVIVAGTGVATASPAGPNVQITDVKSQTGTLQFVLSVGNLPDGETVNPNSVNVTVNGNTLASNAAAGETAANQNAVPVREVILALDTSGSMQGEGITGAKQAARQYAKGLPKDVRLGLVTFSDSPHLLVAPTTDRNAVISALATVTAAGNTSLYDAIVTVANEMRGLPDAAVRRMLILSDGDDTVSKQSEAAAISALKAQKIAADVVAFRLPGNQTILDSIAAASNGRVLPATNASDLANAFSTAAQAFQQQVLVTVQVPQSLSDTDVTLTVTANAGASTFTAQKQVHLPSAGGAGASTPVRRIGAPAVSVSSAGAWAVAGIAFLAILLIALMALYGPVLRQARAGRQARLEEVQRYRVLGAVGNETWNAPPSPGVTDSQSAVGRTALSFVDRTVRARGKREDLVAELDRAGMRMRPEEWAVIQVLAVVIPAVLLALPAGIIGFIIGGIAGFAGVRFYVSTKIRKRAEAFADQLPETLQLLAGSLRTGFSLNQALTSVVREGTEPSASEFSRALAEARLGSELEDALDRVAERMKCEDLSWVVMAIRISRDVGGNLAEVLGTTVVTMRQRVELRGLVRVLSAEGRLSAKVLVGLPIFLAGFMAVFRASYMRPMIHSAGGVIALGVAALLLVLGSIWLNRLTKIEV